MKKNFLKKLMIFGLGLGLLWAGAFGCAASPPAGIPAPVSQLLAVSNPDPSGTVKLSGAPGSVNGGAQVNAGNTSQGAVVQKFQALLIQNAFATSTSVAPLSGSATADPDGSFELRLRADIGDAIRVIQIVEGERSPPTDITVEGDTVDLGFEPQGLATNIDTNTAFVTAGEGEDGIVFAVNFGGETPPLSLPEPSFFFEGLGGIGAIALNLEFARGVAVSTTDRLLVDFNLNTPGDMTLVSVSTPPLDIAMAPASNWAVIGVEASNASIWIYDVEKRSLACNFLIGSISGSAAHVRTPFVGIDSVSDAVDFQIFAISQFSDDSWQLTRIKFLSCGAFGPEARIALPDGINPGGLAPFNQAANALVTDAASNILYVVDFNLGLTPIEVGNSPRGLAVSPGNPFLAHVVNSGENSVLEFNLNSLEVGGTDENVGLMPTEIDLLPNIFQAIVLSPFNNSIVSVGAN